MRAIAQHLAMLDNIASAENSHFRSHRTHIGKTDPAHQDLHLSSRFQARKSKSRPEGGLRPEAVPGLPGFGERACRHACDVNASPQASLPPR